MTRDELYDRMREAFEREARPEAVAAMRWVRDGMEAPLEPPTLAAFVRATAHAPLTLTDADFDKLRAEGRDDPAIFEIVAGAAMGAGLARRDRALKTLRGGRVE